MTTRLLWTPMGPDILYAYSAQTLYDLYRHIDHAFVRLERGELAGLQPIWAKARGPDPLAVLIGWPLGA